ADAPADPAALARRLCARHTGIGADGLILYSVRPGGATMRLWNADGSPSELSGNGLRCLAALIAREQGLDPADPARATLRVETTAGVKTLDLLAVSGARYTFRAAMGQPTGLRQSTIDVGGEAVPVVLLGVGNPQCIVLGPLPDDARFRAIGGALAVHPAFPEGTNVEFVQVETRDRVRILIWERGVGPTTSSGTGSSASAVAAAAFGGAARVVDVVAPGGTQRVDWREDGIFLTGDAEIVLTGVYHG
ncbi:MAG: diaminopimelate epimerase, partial [Vicinamibacterales bacterium]